VLIAELSQRPYDFAGFCSNQSLGTCQTCPPGRESNVAFTVCDSCASGKFSNSTTSIRCQSCPAGTYRCDAANLERTHCDRLAHSAARAYSAVLLQVHAFRAPVVASLHPVLQRVCLVFPDFIQTLRQGSLANLAMPHFFRKCQTGLLLRLMLLNLG